MTYNYNSTDLNKKPMSELTPRQTELLTTSKVFCILPWTHLHVWPNGKVLPCCHAKHNTPVGNCNSTSLKEIWNNDSMKEIRTNMLSETPTSLCTHCYEQEKSGFFSGRQSANKHHGHHIAAVDSTSSTGNLDDFKMIYWDIRFSNLCNLRCRSCGPNLSSGWYQDQSALIGPGWAARNTALQIAGRTSTDIWEQLIEHLDYVEQIYFAGGEPLMMEEHYNILDELVKHKRFDVRLIYNTNFTQLRLKNRGVFDYWKKFNSVSVGASLDGSGKRAEYIRKGTKWDIVVENRKQMLNECPNVDFYISPTFSILNAMHIPDFHREWVDAGLLKPQDVNVNILLDPIEYRVDIAPTAYKNKLEDKILAHLEWLRPLDHLTRATVGYESAIKFIHATNNSSLIPAFLTKTKQLDQVRNENLLDAIPELKELYEDSA